MKPYSTVRVPSLLAACLVACLMAILQGCAIEPPPKIVNPVAHRLKGKTCESYRDEFGVSHFRTTDPLVTFACFGLAHGKDRAWQMDWFRRTAQGRRSEIAGYDEIRSDFLMRLLGFEDRARRLFQMLSPAAQDALWAYSHGVNLGFKQSPGSSSYEFKEWDYSPEPWGPWDSVSVLLLQSFDQTRRGFEEDLAQEKRLSSGGIEAQERMLETGLPWDTSILKEGESTTRATASLNRSYASSAPLSTTDLGFGPTLGGSNNWVIAPGRSLTGKAWFANDPHLGLKNPPFWHWVHIDGPEWDAIGASLPGVPIIVSGTSRKVAWGLTNAYLDAADVVEVPKAALSGSKLTRPWISVKILGMQMPFIFKTFERTRDGLPILPIDAPSGKAYLLKWSGFELSGAGLSDFIRMMGATSVQEMDWILSKVELPNFNFVFADVQGNIGYRSIGRIPRRAAKEYGVKRAASVPLRGWEVLFTSEMPHLINPERGWIATANNRSWPESSGNPGGSVYFKAFRAFRIEELIMKEPKHDLDSMQRIQCDIQAVDARFLLPRMLRQISGGPSRAIELLEQWDLKTAFECKPCGIFRRWIEIYYEKSGDNEASFYRKLEGRDASQSTLREQLTSALAQAWEDVGDRPWGEVHLSAFRHLSGNEEWRRGRIPTAGDRHTVNVGTSDWRPSGSKDTAGWHEQSYGASQRIIVQMSNPPQLHAALAGSNLDVRAPDLGGSESPWREWAECRLKPREFPVVWEGKTLEAADL